MNRQPRGDILGHRAPELREDVRQRLAAAGISDSALREVLNDAGDALYAAASSGKDGWAEPFGGPLAVALLAAEVSALAAHLTSRASAVRALAVGALLDEYSAVTVAAHLGVSRQKVYEISRTDHWSDK